MGYLQKSSTTIMRIKIKGASVSKCRENSGAFLFVFFKWGFTPCKAEQPLQGMELHDKEITVTLQDFAKKLFLYLQI